MRIDIWSDLVCPWCYLGKRRFEKAMSIHGTGASTAAEVVHRSFQLDPSLPKGQSLRPRDVDAQVPDDQPRSSLRRVGWRVSLLPRDSNTYEDAVSADHRTANELGVRGVPFFLIDGRYGVSGAQSLEVFLEALAGAQKR